MTLIIKSFSLKQILVNFPLYFLFYLKILLKDKENQGYKLMKSNHLMDLK
jgi:hypothetical protein